MPRLYGIFFVLAMVASLILTGPAFLIPSGREIALSRSNKDNDDTAGTGFINPYGENTRVQNESWSGVKRLSTNKEIIGELIVEAGTRILMDPGVSLNVTGRMECLGTEKEPIEFKLEGTVGTWEGIRINHTQGGCSNFTSTIFSKGNAPLSITDGSAWIKSCAFTDNNEALHTNHSTVTLSNTTFSECTTNIRLDRVSNIDALNCTIDRYGIKFMDEQSKLNIRWFLHLNFEGDGKPVQVNVFNLNNEKKFEEYIDDAGTIRYIPCLEVIIKKNTEAFHTSHRISYMTEGGPNNRYVYMDGSKSLSLPLLFYADVDNLISRLDTESLKAYARDLLNFPNRWTFSPEHDIAADYLYRRFQNFQNLDDVIKEELFHNGTKVINVVATQSGLEPTSAGVYIIAAHYDTESPTFRGGDDDASGVAALLECARILSSYQFDATIKYVAFDGGANGSGRLGSESFVNATQTEISGALILDRIGYNGGQQNICGVWTNLESQPLVDNLTRLIGKLGIEMNIRSRLGNLDGQNDYASFWNRSHPAVGLSESIDEDTEAWWPQRPASGADHDDLDFDYISRFGQLCAATIFDYSKVKSYRPMPPQIITSNKTHLTNPTVRWEPSFDFNGDDVEYRISVEDNMNGTTIISPSYVKGTRFTFHDPLVYGHQYYFNISAVENLSENGKPRYGQSSEVTSFNLSVENNAPRFDVLKNRTFYEDKLDPILLEAVDTDEPSDTLEFRLVEKSRNSTLCGSMLNRTSGELRWRPENGDVGDHRIRFNVTDGLGGADEVSINITVINENDNPEPDQTMINEIFEGQNRNILHMKEDSYVYLDPSLLFYDPDIEIGNETGLNFTNHTSNPFVLVNTEENGSYNISSERDYNGNATITIDAKDMLNSSASFDFLLDIDPVNDAPIVRSIGMINTSEKEYVMVTLEYGERKDYYDVDNGPDGLSFSFFPNKGVWTLDDDNTTWNYLWRPGYRESGMHEIFINVSDGDRYINSSFIINITDVPIGPVAMIKIPDMLEPGAPVTFDASKSSDLDGITGRPTGYMWDFGDGSDSTGWLSEPKVEHVFAKPGKYIVTLTVRDGDYQENITTLEIDIQYQSITEKVVCAIIMVIGLVAVMGFALSRVGRKEIQRRTMAAERKRAKVLARKKKRDGSDRTGAREKEK